MSNLSMVEFEREDGAKEIWNLYQVKRIVKKGSGGCWIFPVDGSKKVGVKETYDELKGRLLPR